VALAPTQYVRSGDADIAYQIIGDGERDIVVVLDWASHLEAFAEQPFFVDLFTSLTRFGRVLWLGPRGVGMSGPLREENPIESWMHDLVTVMDEAGVERANLVAHGLGAQAAVMTAATHPERCESLVVVNGYVRFARGADYPAGLPEHMHEAYLDAVESQWGTGVHALGLGPSVVHRPGVVDWWARVERFSATPRVAREQLQAILTLDARSSVPLVVVPTLVIHNRDNVFARVGHGRYLAEHIPNARYLERGSADHWPVPDDDLIGAIEEFIPARGRASPRRTGSSRRSCSSTSSARPSSRPSWVTARGERPSSASSSSWAPRSPLSKDRSRAPPGTASWRPSTAPPVRSAVPYGSGTKPATAASTSAAGSTRAS
jgi:pimeloyl-ACP methyl ester carboxylesterase